MVEQKTVVDCIAQFENALLGVESRINLLPKPLQIYSYQAFNVPSGDAEEDAERGFKHEEYSAILGG